MPRKKKNTITISEPKKRGRPQFVLDLDKLEELAEKHATDEEMFSILGCSQATFTRLKQHEEVTDAIARGRANLQVSLRTKQIELAKNGDTTMLIWLGKVLLGQKEAHKVEVDATVHHVDHAKDDLIESLFRGTPLLEAPKTEH